MADVAQRYADLAKEGLPVAMQLRKQDLYQYGENYEVRLTNGVTVRIEEHEFDRYVKLFTKEPEKSGQFGKDLLYKG